jgi:hypothetical protein
MEKIKMKKFHCCVLLLAMALFFFVFSTGGCGGDGSDGDGGDETPVKAEHTLSVLGTIPAELVGPMREIGIEIAEFDTKNPSAHKSVLITKEALSEIVSGTGIAQDIYDIYSSSAEKTGHIVLYRPDDADIEKLGELLGESFGGGVDEGGSLLFYAIDMDTNVVRTFSHMNSNGLTERITVDGETEVVERVIISEISSADQKAMKDWLLDGADGNESVNAKISSLDASQNLLGLAMGYQSTLSFNAFDPVTGKRLTTNIFITALHVFDDGTSPDGGSDWFFIREDNQFDGNNGYVRKLVPRGFSYSCIINSESLYCNDGEVADNFIENVKVKHWLDATNVDDVVLTDTQPVTINGSTTTSQTVGFNIDGPLTGGYQGKGPDQDKAPGSFGRGSFSGGLSVSETRSFSTPDVSAQMTTGDPNVPSWEYRYAIPHKTDSQRLQGGATLAWTTYTPQQVWIWRIPTNSRSDIKRFYLSYDVTRGAVIAYDTGTIGADDAKHITGDESSAGMAVNFPYPPLLAFEKTTIVLGREESSDSTAVRAQGDWSYTVSGDVDWIRSTRAPDGRLYVGVLENTTGRNRTGEIILTRNVPNPAADDTGVLTVTQLATKMN